MKTSKGLLIAAVGFAIGYIARDIKGDVVVKNINVDVIPITGEDFDEAEEEASEQPASDTEERPSESDETETVDNNEKIAAFNDFDEPAESEVKTEETQKKKSRKPRKQKVEESEISA